jgi:hypothetical protein
MSALTKPMIHSVSVTNLENGVSPMVNAERVTSIDIIEIAQVQNNSGGPKFEIVFTMATDPKTGVPGQVKWQYVDRSALDTDYALIVNTISTVAV